MTDIVDKKTRSKMMAGIHAENTIPEITIRKFLFGQSFRYRLHYKNLPGKPDIVLPKYRVVVFVHGCFWHRHQGCKLNYAPQSNSELWQSKFEKNILRDKKQINALISEGWRVIVIWECGLRSHSSDLSWLPNEIRSGSMQYSEWPPRG